MVDVFTHFQITRTYEEMAAYASDLDNAPAWYVSIKSVKRKTPKPLVIG